MNTVNHIFKKDFTKLKVLLSIWIILLIMRCIDGSSTFLDNYKMQLYLPDINALIAGLQYLMVIVIIPLVIQDDPLVGNSAFWLTRPISRKQLLIEKMFFLALFLLILPLCAGMFVLMSNGVAFKYLAILIPEFLHRQMVFIIPVLILASITQKFSKFALAGIVILVVWYLISLVTNLFPLLYDIKLTKFLENSMLAKIEPHNVSLEWSINLIKLIASILICGFIIHNQFIYRDTKRTIKWIVYGFILVAIINKFWSWDYLNIGKIKPNQLPISQSINVIPERNSVWTYDGYGFAKKKPEEKYKEVYLTQNVEGLSKDQFALVDKLKNPHLTYTDGKTLTWDEDIDGKSYSSVDKFEFINPIESVLKNTKILNKYKREKAHSLLINVLDVNFDKYKNSVASYKADARFNIYQYKVTSVLPLKKGNRAWINNKQFVIYDVIKTTFGVKIVIGEKKVDLTLAEDGEKKQFPFDDFGFSRDMDYNQPFYILRNKRTGDAFVPEIARNTQISKPKFNDSAILKNRIAQFIFTHENDRNVGLPTIDEEWLKDAELIRLESQKIGYFNKKLEYDKILLDEKKDYVEKDGMKIYYFDTGEIKKEQPDVNVKQETMIKTYFKTGDLEGAWAYKDGELNGISKVYYQDGKLMTEWLYKNGVLNGISKSYYQSGGLFYEYPYVDGELHGVAKKYSKTGELIAEKVFEKGELIDNLPDEKK